MNYLHNNMDAFQMHCAKKLYLKYHNYKYIYIVVWQR
jgi:hypothetical protein